ncbi:MAG: RNA polymerase sigma factor [Sphingobacteriales bacterium]
MANNTRYIDQNLLSRLRNGDRLAFDELYSRHWERVYAQAFKKLNDPDVAKDITQDVFIRLWINRETNHIDHLEAYLFAAVRNNIFRYLKEEGRFIPIADLLLETRSYWSEPDAATLERELRQAYEAMLSSMPPAQQTIFKMRFQEELSTQEIAEQLNISRKTVQNQLTKAVSMLKTSLLAIALLHILR